MAEQKQRYGFIGLGNMGGPMVRRLAGLGLELAVYDVNEAQLRAVAGSNVLACASAEEIGAQAQTVFLSLPTPDIVTRAVLGERGLALGKKVRNVIDFSTIGTRAAAHVGGTLARQGVTYVDAPVAGGVTGAGTGKLLMMVSCPPDAFERLRETLALFGKAHFVGSEAGQGQTMKLVNNMLSACALAATAEAMVFGVKAGLDPAVMLEILNGGSGRNSATGDKFPRAVLPRTFDFGFTTDLAIKDVNLCVAESEAAGVPMMMGARAKEMLLLTKAIRGGQSDFTEICRMVEDWAGVVVESKPKR
jgi:3-hydroxyisobutyrate dehydrogenase-like beta-hydroxyacid dehydrogenase